MLQFISHRDGECTQFFDDYFVGDRRALFIGTLGFNDFCLHFPRALASKSNIDFIFLVEERSEVSGILTMIAERNRGFLSDLLKERKLQFASISIVAEDTANVAGRSATKACQPLLANGYTDVIVDATSMSRGVCFPIVKQAFQYSSRSRSGLQAHVVIAGPEQAAGRASSMSSDAPQYMHGFQSNMDVDDSYDSIKLWIPQLAEGAMASLARIHRRLNPNESCPILPFPSADPRRGDRLLREFQEPVLNDWDVNLLDIIYAHESDPNDVCDTIVRIHCRRHEALSKATRQLHPDRTVLSPAGTRIGSIGMLLAALKLDLPIMYEESIGYTSVLTAVPALTELPPEHVWHVWLRP